MNQTIDAAKCKLYYKLLVAAFLGFAVPILLLILRLVPPPQEGGPGFVPLLMVASALLFYVFIGILAAKNQKSVVLWVGLSLLTSPIGPIVALFLMTAAGKKNGWL